MYSTLVPQEYHFPPTFYFLVELDETFAETAACGVFATIQPVIEQALVDLQGKFAEVRTSLSSISNLHQL